jgi:hypothetical protein
MRETPTYRQFCLTQYLTNGTRTSLRRACIASGYSRGRTESWAGLLADKGIVQLFADALAEGRPMPWGREDQVREAVGKLLAEGLE